MDIGQFGIGGIGSIGTDTDTDTDIANFGIGQYRTRGIGPTDITKFCQKWPIMGKKGQIRGNSRKVSVGIGQPIPTDTV